MVVRVVRSISTDRLGRGVFRSGLELTGATEECITVHNQKPNTLVWTAKANDIYQNVFAPITGLVPRITKHYSSLLFSNTLSREASIGLGGLKISSA